MNISKSIMIMAAILIPVIYSSGGNYPFPRNVDYAYGQKPSNALAGHANLAYLNWKAAYYDEMDDNTGRVFFNEDKDVVSEGIAYGMLLSVYADDKNVFDRLWRYYQKHSNFRGIMHWRINVDDQVIGYNGATDAEEDAAMALIVAHYQWGSDGGIDYMQDALDLIDAIMQYEVEKPSYRLKCGDGWGTSPTTNPSYLAPAYFKVFYELTGNTEWLQVVDKSYEILALNANATTGLVSDWCLPDGTKDGGRSDNHTYDASRFPWRMATDYLWYGDERAKDYCNRMSAFIRDDVKGSKNISGNGYTRSGNSLGGSHNPVFVGTFALTGMGADPSFQTHLNDSYTDVANTNPGEYFGATLHAIGLFMLTGNFYKMPEIELECTSPELGPGQSLCDNPEITLSTGLEDESGIKFLWSNGETGNSILVTEPGTYWLKTDSLNCIRYDTVTISKFQVSLGPDKVINSQGEIIQVTPDYSMVNYEWSTGATGSSITVQEEGQYWVRADSAGCIDQDTINIQVYTEEKFVVNPNPSAGGILYLYAQGIDYDKMEIKLFDLRGKQVFASKYSANQSGAFSVSKFPSGIYVLKAYFYNNNNLIKEKTENILIDN